MTIEIHILTYNEQVMLPFTIQHYRRMFGNPKIVVHDNGSKDETIMLAKLAGCEVVPFHTDGMNDTMQSRVKSDAAMNATADWVLCIDCDEECMITTYDLQDLEDRGINVVHFEGWDIFDQVTKPEDITVPMGCRSPGYYKPVLLRTGTFSTIEFGAGAHNLERLIPMEGKSTNMSIHEYKLLHYKHWSDKWVINRSAELGARQSSENLQKGHSGHLLLPANAHQEWFDNHYKSREVIHDKRIKVC
jgi:hypothetical protein